MSLRRRDGQHRRNEAAFCFPAFVVELALSASHANIVGANGLRPPLRLEKYEGYAEEFLKGFAFGPNDAFIV